MSDNTLQFQWIVTIKGGLDALFRHDPDVFVAGDLLWYPVEGKPKIRIGPDVLVAFGRPKGERGSYRQWEEGGIAPQVVFEILSPGNRSRGTGPEVPVLSAVWRRGILRLRPRPRLPGRLAQDGASAQGDSQDGGLRQPAIADPVRTGRGSG